jgi:hypothetical protein
MSGQKRDVLLEITHDIFAGVEKAAEGKSVSAIVILSGEDGGYRMQFSAGYTKNELAGILARALVSTVGIFGDGIR